MSRNDDGTCARCKQNGAVFCSDCASDDEMEANANADRAELAAVRARLAWAEPIANAAMRYVDAYEREAYLDGDGRTRGRSRHREAERAVEIALAALLEVPR